MDNLHMWSRVIRTCVSDPRDVATGSGQTGKDLVSAPELRLEKQVSSGRSEMGNFKAKGRLDLFPWK